MGLRKDNYTAPTKWYPNTTAVDKAKRHPIKAQKTKRQPRQDKAKHEADTYRPPRRRARNTFLLALLLVIALRRRHSGACACCRFFLRVTACCCCCCAASCSSSSFQGRSDDCNRGGRKQAFIDAFKGKETNDVRKELRG